MHRQVDAWWGWVGESGRVSLANFAKISVVLNSQKVSRARKGTLLFKKPFCQMYWASFAFRLLPGVSSYGVISFSATYILVTISSWFPTLTWIMAPFIFNPTAFAWPKTVLVGRESKLFHKPWGPIWRTHFRAVKSIFRKCQTTCRRILKMTIHHLETLTLRCGTQEYVTIICIG